MSISEPRLYLICYDVADPRRLQRVHYYLKHHALAVQYSVFLTRAPERRLQSILGGVAERIDPQLDDVRAYPLPADCDPVSLGRQYFPSGLLLADPLLDPLLREANAAGSAFQQEVAQRRHRR
jgi:CRISPR-associated protein Cas2